MWVTLAYINRRSDLVNLVHFIKLNRYYYQIGFVAVTSITVFLKGSVLIKIIFVVGSVGPCKTHDHFILSGERVCGTFHIWKASAER